jgi:chemotaxis signal transduction protein
MTEIFAFRAANRLVGIETRHVYRVVDEADLLPAPFTPPCYMGVIYHRGEIFDVIDAGAALYSSPPGGCGKNSRVILLKWDGYRLGLVPEAVSGLMAHPDGGSGEDAVQLLDPGSIRERALELHDGFIEIRKDIRPGV